MNTATKYSRAEEMRISVQIVYKSSQNMNHLHIIEYKLKAKYVSCFEKAINIKNLLKK